MRRKNNECYAGVFVDWRDEHGIDMAYIRNGKPQKNGFADRFNDSFNREYLDAYSFGNLDQIRDMAWFWMIDYNDERPRVSLGELPTRMYR